jgi:hypothetical protein
MPSNPQSGKLHTDAPLTNLVIGNMQSDEGFIYNKVAPVLDVDKLSGTFYSVPPGGYNRKEIAPRGSGEAPRVGGWTTSSGSFSIHREGVSTEFDYTEKSNIDQPMQNSDALAADWLKNQARMHGEYLLGAKAFKAGVWSEDWSGAGAKNYATSAVLYWDNASANPRMDVMHIANLIRKRTGGRKPNTIIVGAAVHEELVGGDILGDKVDQSTLGSKDAMEDFVRRYFGMKNYFEGGAVYNSAKEGDTDSMTFQLAEDSVWIGYVDGSASSSNQFVPTAMRTMAYRDGGRNKQGINIRRWTEIKRTVDCVALDLYIDVVPTFVDAGAYISDVLT